MRYLGITDGSVFEKWLDEEREHLTHLQKPSSNESLEVEYFHKLNEHNQTL